MTRNFSTVASSRLLAAFVDLDVDPQTLENYGVLFLDTLYLLEMRSHVNLLLQRHKRMTLTASQSTA